MRESIRGFARLLEGPRKGCPKDVTTTQLGTLEVKEKRGRQAISNYVEAVIKCLALEDIPEKEQEDDEHAIQRGEFEDGLNGMECQIGALRARIQEEKVLAKARETAGGGTTQTGNNTEGCSIKSVLNENRK